MIVLMIEVVTVIGLFVFGAAFGSFAAAQVWRLRAAQLKADRSAGAKIPKKDLAEVKNLLDHTKVTKDRSRCLHCGRTLKWYELLPVVSWLAVRGRCHTCKQPIGSMEFIAELSVGLVFVASYMLWPYELTQSGVALLGLWFVLVVLLAVHWMYDAKWFLLLDKITIGVLFVSILFWLVHLTTVDVFTWSGALLGTAYTLLALPGVYLLLYVVSKGQWVGFGDVKLLVPFALLLPSWEYGVLLFFLANLLGSAVLLPAMLTRKLERTTRVPFGPFLIAALGVTTVFGQKILEWYFGLMLY